MVLGGGELEKNGGRFKKELIKRPTALNLRQQERERKRAQKSRQTRGAVSKKDGPAGPRGRGAPGNGPSFLKGYGKFRFNAKDRVKNFVGG